MHCIRTMFVLVLVLFVHVSGYALAQTLTQSYFDESFTSTQNTAWATLTPAATITDGHLVLSYDGGKKYDGTQIVFPTALHLPQPSQGMLHLSLTIDKVDATTGGWSLRYFLLPEKLAPFKWIDPYGKPHVLSLNIEDYKGDSQKIQFSLYSNDGTAKGSGKLLYHGVGAANTFPLTVDLQCNQEVFTLKYSADIQTRTGARSGHHGLNVAQWNGDAGCGIRLVNLTQDNTINLHLSHASAQLYQSDQPNAAANDTQPAEDDSAKLTADIRVYPKWAQAIGGYDQVQALFGGNTNGESRGGANALLRELNLNTSRLHLWPETFGAPKQMQSPATPYFVAQFGTIGGYLTPIPESEVDAAWDKWFKLDFSQFIDPMIAKGVANPHGGSMASQLVLQKEWNSTDNIIFYATHKMDAGAVRNSEGVCRYLDQYLDAVNKYAPWLNVTFAQLFNEPNYSWFVNSFGGNQAKAVQGYVDLYNVVDKHLRQTHPKTQILGPCLASSEFFSWGGWNEWTIPVLKGAQYDLEYYNYHNYDTAAVSHLAWVQMLQAQALALGKGKPRAIVTEMNDDAVINVAANKFEWWSEHLFYALENPDKIHALEYFLTVWRKGQQGNLVYSDGNTYHPTDTYWLYWVLRDTRGQLRHIQMPALKDLKVIACSPRENQLVISLFNNTGRTVEINLDSGLSDTASIKQLVRYAAWKQNQQVQHVQETMASQTKPNIQIRNGEVQSYVWDLNEPLTADAGKLDQQEYYAKTVAQKFGKDGLNTKIMATRLPQADETVALRFAVFSDDVLAARGLSCSVNGYQKAVAWTDAPREREHSQRTLWWMEMSVPRDVIAIDNALVFSDVDTDYRLMFASLIYRQQPSVEHAKSLEKQRLFDANSNIAVRFAPIKGLIEDQAKDWSLELVNRSDSPVTCTLNVRVPANVTLKLSSPDQPIFVPANATHRVTGTIMAKQCQTVELERLLVNLQTDAGIMRDYPMTISVYPKRQAAHMKQKPVIDGKLDDWTEMHVINMQSNGKRAGMQLGWDEQHLYFAVTVKTGHMPTKPEIANQFWKGDVLELFVDPGNKKSRLYAPTDGQFYFCPYGSTSNQSASGRCLRIRKAESVVHNGTQHDGPWQCVYQADDTGYVLEGFVPWSCLDPDFKAEAGSMVGMDAAISGFTSMFGTKNKPFDTPSQWGILTLE